jgi:CHAD domain-containing protein
MSLHPQKAGRRYTARVAALQDVLGHLNDAGIARRLLDLLIEWMGPEAPAEAVRATGLVEGWTARGAEDALRNLDGLWKRFEKTKPFWS